MGPIVKFKMTGQKELLDKFRRMDRKIKRKVAAKALRAGAKIMVAALRQAAPRDTGKGAKAIGTKIKTYRNTAITVAISGERSQSRKDREKGKKSKFGGPHLHLVEYGTVRRFRTGIKTARAAAKATGLKFDRMAFVAIRGASTGRVTPKPFFQRTWKANIQRMQAAQVAVLRREIEAIARSA